MMGPLMARVPPAELPPQLLKVQPVAVHMHSVVFARRARPSSWKSGVKSGSAGWPALMGMTIALDAELRAPTALPAPVPSGPVKGVLTMAALSTALRADIGLVRPCSAPPPPHATRPNDTRAKAIESFFM